MNQVYFFEYTQISKKKDFVAQKYLTMIFLCSEISRMCLFVAQIENNNKYFPYIDNPIVYLFTSKTTLPLKVKSAYRRKQFSTT